MGKGEGRRSSWLPKSSGRFTVRNSSDGRFVTGTNPHIQGPITHKSTAAGNVVFERSGIVGQVQLPNGDTIRTLRKDVLDRALGRGDFEKK